MLSLPNHGRLGQVPPEPSSAHQAAAPDPKLVALSAALLGHTHWYTTTARSAHHHSGGVSGSSTTGTAQRPIRKREAEACLPTVR